MSMWWPWRRRHSAHLDDAQRHLDQLQAQQPEVTRLSRELREDGHHNRFAARISQALRGAT